MIYKECFPLREVIRFYTERFRTAAADQYHLLRSLTYFDDAEDEPMPEMKKQIHWNDVKFFLLKK